MNLERAYAIAHDLAPHAQRREQSIRAAMADVQELAGVEARHWKPRIARLIRDREIQNAGGQYYQDTRPPWLVADTASVATAVAATYVLMWPVLANTPTYATDWFPGKLFMLRCFGRMTTTATPGALTIALSYGTAVNSGILATAVFTVAASQTNLSWRAECRVRCRAVSSAGGAASTLLGTGMFEANPTLVTSPAGGGPVPASAAAPFTTADLSGTSGIGLQMQQPATIGTAVVVHDLELAALN